MASKEVMLKVAKMAFSEPVKTNKEIALELYRDGIFRSPRQTKAVKTLIEQTGQWLLREQTRLDDYERSGIEEKRLSEKLCETFGLLDARVVPGGDPSQDGYAPLRLHADAAARYIDEAIGELEDKNEPADVLVSGGETILSVVSALPQRDRPKTCFYAAAITERGRKAMAIAHIGPETNATIAWSRSGSYPLRLCYGTAAPYQISEDRDRSMSKLQRHNHISGEISRAIDHLLRTKPIREIIEDTNRVNMAIAGLGLLQPTKLEVMSGKLENASRISMNFLLHRYGIDLDILGQQGAIGDINYAMFNKDGETLPQWRFFITPGAGTSHSGAQFYRNMVRKGQKVIVTAGARKEAVLLPAMEAKLLNVLITDAYTARRLLLNRNG